MFKPIDILLKKFSAKQFLGICAVMGIAALCSCGLTLWTRLNPSDKIARFQDIEKNGLLNIRIHDMANTNAAPIDVCTRASIYHKYSILPLNDEMAHINSSDIGGRMITKNSKGEWTSVPVGKYSRGNTTAYIVYDGKITTLSSVCDKIKLVYTDDSTVSVKRINKPFKVYEKVVEFLDDDTYTLKFNDATVMTFDKDKLINARAQHSGKDIRCNKNNDDVSLFMRDILSE